MLTRHAFAVVGMLSLVACISGSGSRLVLHDSSPSPGADDVATLQGYVRFVDDRYVEGQATVFELMPGCHLVRTPAAWGTADGNKGGVMVHTGEQLLAIPMKPGHSYIVEVVVGQMTGPVGEAYVRARERSAQGVAGREFLAVRSQAEIRACDAESP